MKIYKLIFITASLLFISEVPAFSYIDPGTGSIILQALLGIIAAIGASITLYYQKIKNFFSKFKKKKIKNNNNE